MIICSNCGATNSETDGRICRKCGALLPISNRPSRLRMSIGSVNKEDFKEPETESEPTAKSKSQETPSIGFFSPQQLQQIPKSQPIEEQSPVKKKKKKGQKKEILKEITPAPFRGSIIADRNVYGPSARSQERPQPRSLPQQKIDPIPKQELSQIPSAAPPTFGESTVSVRQRLEEDMASVVSTLSKTLKIPEVEKPKEAVPKTETSEEKIAPSSMNDILKQLLNIDQRIEASAIIKTDGTILASAISSRISDSLFATIGQNLSMIGNDIIESLNSGELRTISIRGSAGVLDLAPIDKKHRMIKDMILMIFSHPKVKSGVINIAANLVKKQIKDYLGIQEK